jgi:hypothetical protein
MNHVFHTFDNPGFAQVGQENFELKDRFQTIEMMRLIKSVKPPKGVQFKIEQNPYDVAGTMFNYLSIDLYLDDKVKEETVIKFIDRFEEIDPDEIEKSLHEGFKAIEILLANQEMLPKSLALSIDEVTELYGFNDIIDLIEVAMDEGAVPSMCPMGCRTEPDGKCQHGFASILLTVNII